MDHLLAKLNTLTETIVAEIDQATFEQLDHFVEQRALLLDELQSIASSSPIEGYHRNVLQDILQHDETIMNRMTMLKDEAAHSISKISHGKTQKNAYDAVYSLDSIYFDKKK